MENKISVTILDDHQSIVDGYRFRLSNFPQIEIITTLEYGEDLENALKKQAPDVLILDVNVKVSAENSNNYPIFHVIPDLLQRYPDLAILVISMHNDRSIIRAVMEGGASGYILKDDQRTLQELGSVILSIVSGGIFLSEKVRNLYVKNRSATSEEPLTGRQMEALSLCAAYPDHTTEKLAQIMNVANSTVRNLLSGAYLRLGVNSRAAAIAKARQLGLIPPDAPPLPL
ncbi:MAG TPA: response regulator transcription factor [Anaerolineales bacterium]|nr:response regulator transcription factor [Anaerolineales bacterium]